MEIITFVVGFVVFLLEYLALSLMLYMLLTWALAFIEGPAKRVHRYVVHHISQLRWVRDAVLFWQSLRMVRRQLGFVRP